MQSQPSTSGDHRVEPGSAVGHDAGDDPGPLGGAGWLLVQRDWGLRQRDPCEPPTAIWRRVSSAVASAAARVWRQLTRLWRAPIRLSSDERSETARSSAVSP